MSVCTLLKYVPYFGAKFNIFKGFFYTLPIKFAPCLWPLRVKSSTFLAFSHLLQASKRQNNSLCQTLTLDESRLTILSFLLDTNRVLLWTIPALTGLRPSGAVHLRFVQNVDVLDELMHALSVIVFQFSVSDFLLDFSFLLAPFVNTQSGIQPRRSRKSKTNHGRQSTYTEVIAVGSEVGTFICVSRRIAKVKHWEKDMQSVPPDCQLFVYMGQTSWLIWQKHF